MIPQSPKPSLNRRAILGLWPSLLGCQLAPSPEASPVSMNSTPSEVCQHVRDFEARSLSLAHATPPRTNNGPTQK